MGDTLFSYDTLVLAASGAAVGGYYLLYHYVLIKFILSPKLVYLNDLKPIFICKISTVQGSVTAACITMPLTTAFTRLQLEDKRQTRGPVTTMLELVRMIIGLTISNNCVGRSVMKDSSLCTEAASQPCSVFQSPTLSTFTPSMASRKSLELEVKLLSRICFLLAQQVVKITYDTV